MRLRLVIGLLILYLVFHVVASAAMNSTVLHIGQGDIVYYGDVVDLRGITGWTGTLAHWKTYHSPSSDNPDAFANITKWERFVIDANMEPGEWYTWYGKNEKSPTMIFYVVNGKRPVPKTTPPPEPVKTSIAPIIQRTQPAPIADFVVARWESFSFDPGEAAQVWIIGPTMILGNQTNSPLVLDPVMLMPGDYTVLIQYPDGNGIFEIFRRDTYIDSIWKGVDPLWITPLGSDVLLTKIKEIFNDTSHFHGRIVEKKMVVGAQQVDIGTLEQTDEGIFVSGTTNLKKGSPIQIVFDEKENVLYSDRNRSTFTAYAEGTDPGAMRTWRGTLNINLQTERVGTHFITAYPPYGEPVTAPFYVSENFKPFEVPDITIRYINMSPFIPTPTPVVIER